MNRGGPLRMSMLMPSLGSLAFAASGPCPTRAAASAEDAKRAEAASKIADAMNRNPDLAQKVLKGLSEDKRRELLVFGSSNEWLSKKGKGEGRRQLHRADQDRDDRISQKDYNEWVEQQVSSRETVDWKTIAKIAFAAAGPFVAFGFMDNCVMILSGDVIGNTVGDKFSLSPMAAAALGGVCSGTLGIQIHGFADRLLTSIGLGDAAIPHGLHRHPSVLRAGHIGGSLGIALGLSLGMMPLLFISHEDDREVEMMIRIVDEATDSSLSSGSA